MKTWKFFGCALAGAFALAVPSAASATDCPLPGSVDASMNSTPLLDVTGHIPQSLNGDYVQVPFDVPAGATAIQVRYSYDQPGASPGDPGVCGSGPNTLDMGVYGPRQGGETYWTQADSRGWSGSAVKNLAVAVDGYNSDAAYDVNRKGFFPGFTTRAYRPGPMPAGKWALELGDGWIDPGVAAAGIQYHVQVSVSTDALWTAHPWAHTPYDPSPVNSTPGWYAGDLHVHGEMEPGNATMTQTFNRAFGAAPAGGGLDFVTQVDHNNDIARDELGTYQAAHPTKLIVPGVEETTYHGHFMNSGSGTLGDYHTTSIYLLESPATDPDVNPATDQVRGPVAPSQFFADAQAAGGYAEINHPTIYQTAPSFCRGCFWDYTDEQTDFSTVNAVEIANGPPTIGATSPNPFTPTAIAYYEHVLDSGAHAAAVSGSDDHKGGGDSGPTYTPVGIPTTMVHASALSEAAVVDAIKNAHTYVEPFGVSGPDIDLSAKVSGSPPGDIGDTVSGPSAKLTASVAEAASTGRPGSFAFVLLQDGAATQTVPFTGDAATHVFTVKANGRYALEVTRTNAATEYIEDYSSPIWFISNAFRFLKPKLDSTKGTGAVRAKVPGAGKLVLSGKDVKKGRFTAKKAGTVTMPIKLTPKAQHTLDRKGKLGLDLDVAYTPTGGKKATKTTHVTLRKK